MDTPTAAYDAAIEYARSLGAEHGHAAATWYFDGNTPADAYAPVLRGIEDGDPAILDTLPAPDLSGQWADSLTGPQLVRDALAAADIDLSADDSVTDDSVAWDNDICDAYEFAFSSAAEDEIARVARYQTGGR